MHISPAHVAAVCQEFTQFFLHYNKNTTKTKVIFKYLKANHG